MESLELKGNICRICLEQKAVLNWNDEIFELCGATYKDCYYKFTQLKILVVDPYSQMLCQICSTDLRTSHSLVVKALESYATLQQTYPTEDKIVCNENEETKQEFADHMYEPKYEPDEFEILILKQNEEPLIEVNNDIECNIIPKIETNEAIQERKKRRYNRKPKYAINTILPSSSDEEISNKNKSKKQERQTEDDSDGKDFDTISDNEPLQKSRKVKQKSQVKIKKKSASKTTNAIDESKEEPNKTKTCSKKIFICSICSKTYKDKRNLIKHEESHRGHRKRSEVCPHCGIKLLCKDSLHLHLKTHDANREKFKCDFCDKVYLNRGALNVHSRIHLGQMIPCPICSKEFYRQIDLDRHNIAAHSGATIHTDAAAKKLSKYYVYCKECNKHLRSTTWRSHQAAHLKEPLMECSLCSKTFFRRNSCTFHMKKVHNYNKRDEYEQFIIYLKNRLTHLMMKQQGVIKPIET